MSAVAAPAGKLSAVSAAAYRIPTDAPESDGTFAWDATTIVVVEVEGGGERGLGYTYGDAAVAGIAGGALAEAVRGIDVLDTGAAHAAAAAALRNIGRTGPGAMALSARGTTCARGCSVCRCGECSARCATASRSTARAGSRRTTTSGSRGSSRAGHRTASRA